MLGLGEPVGFSFQLPGSEREVVLEGVVAWTNPGRSTRSTACPRASASPSGASTRTHAPTSRTSSSEYLKRQTADE